MTQTEIKGHEGLKAKFPNYPKLPRFILKKGDKSYTKPNQGLMDSCTRGFNKRLTAWKDDFQKFHS